MVHELFGLRVQAARLPGYEDENFRVVDSGGRAFVLKIAATGQSEALLDFQEEALLRLTQAGLPTPELLPDRRGALRARLADGPQRGRFVRLLSWLEGVPLAQVRAPRPEIYRSLGNTLAHVDRVLASIDHPAASRALRWDLLRAPEAREWLDAQTDRARRERLEAVFGHFEAVVLPRLEKLPRAVIHNDGNDANVMVPGALAQGTESATLLGCGLIDFGDMLRTARISELAIALAYACLREPIHANPAGDGVFTRALVRGYLEVQPLEKSELELVPELVEARLAVSVSSSAWERLRDPDNAYLSVTEPHAWRFLSVLDEGARERMRSRLLSASS